jgi:hypothetical protein
MNPDMSVFVNSSSFEESLVRSITRAKESSHKRTFEDCLVLDTCVLYQDRKDRRSPGNRVLGRA